MPPTDHAPEYRVPRDATDRSCLDGLYLAGREPGGSVVPGSGLGRGGAAVSLSLGAPEMYGVWNIIRTAALED